MRQPLPWTLLCPSCRSLISTMTLLPWISNASGLTAFSAGFEPQQAPHAPPRPLLIPERSREALSAALVPPPVAVTQHGPGVSPPPPVQNFEHQRPSSRQMFQPDMQAARPVQAASPTPMQQVPLTRAGAPEPAAQPPLQQDIRGPFPDPVQPPAGQQYQPAPHQLNRGSQALPEQGLPSTSQEPVSAGFQSSSAPLANGQAHASEGSGPIDADRELYARELMAVAALEANPAIFLQNLHITVPVSLQNSSQCIG